MRSRRGLRENLSTATASECPRQVMRSDDVEMWHEAIQKELTRLYRDRKCWKYVPSYPPKDTQLNAHFICEKKLRLLSR